MKVTNTFHGALVAFAERREINMIDDRLPMAYKVLDGDDHSIIVKDRVTGKEFEIVVKEIIE